MLHEQQDRGTRHEQRRIERQQLASYLQVFNRHSGRSMGYLGNISRDGMMLISDLPVMLDSIYELQIKLPGVGNEVELLNFTALSHWCRPEKTSGHFDSGFSIVHNRQGFFDLAHSLRCYFSFAHPVDA